MKVALTPCEFGMFSKYIIENWGIDLDGSKLSLLESRLRILLDKYQCASYYDLYHQVKHNHKVGREVIDAISTNETSFFRGKPVFDLLKKKIIPSCFQKNKSLNIWSAACSTGQEVYTLAIILKELASAITLGPYHIIGTDISDQVLEQAKRGEYTQLEIDRGINQERLTKFFHLVEEPTTSAPVNGSSNSHLKYQINDNLKSSVQFQNLNLTDPLSYYSQYDIVLCRNVTIYFNLEMRRIVYDRIANTLKPGGFLILGGAEILFEISDRFESHNENNVLYYQLL